MPNMWLEWMDWCLYYWIAGTAKGQSCRVESRRIKCAAVFGISFAMFWLCFVGMRMKMYAVHVHRTVYMTWRVRYDNLDVFFFSSAFWLAPLRANKVMWIWEGEPTEGDKDKNIRSEHNMDIIQFSIISHPAPIINWMVGTLSSKKNVTCSSGRGHTTHTHTQNTLLHTFCAVRHLVAF